MDSVLGLLAVFLLVAMNGFFVAAEFSLVGARRTRITQLANEGNAGARAAESAIEHLDSFIAATQLGITLASLGLGWIGEPAFAHLLDPVLEFLLPEEWMDAAGHTASVAVAFALVTMLHIVFGELAPKSIALNRPEGTSIIVSRPTTWFLRVFRPIIRLMNSVGNAVVRALGFEPAGGHSQVHSAEELEMLVHSSQEAGLLQKSEEILLRRVFDFSDIEIQEVMQPRVEVDGIPIDLPLPLVLQRIAQQHHSRYPIYQDSLDNLVGILHAKDLFDTVVRQPDLLTSDGAHLDLKTLLRDPLFVPTTVGVDKVLEQMQRTKTHIAVVMDEYGGMAGIATMEDILEELVGEVQDEFDLESEPIHRQGDMAILDGLVTLDDVIERFGNPGGNPRSQTIGGYVAERLGQIPEVKDTIPFGDYEICVEDMDGMRVSKVRVVKRPKAAPETDGDNEVSAPQ
ncbi:MAG TPA: hemolysin family protein [Aggregatilineaceae bacterium]|nr:hemolysin family protein [Aggregatilineaceae bacterium]